MNNKENNINKVYEEMNRDIYITKMLELMSMIINNTSNLDTNAHIKDATSRINKLALELNKKMKE